MSANPKKISTMAIVVLVMTVLAAAAVFLALWDTTSATMLEYVQNALKEPTKGLAVCLLVMAGAVVLALVAAVLALWKPKAMIATAVCGAVGAVGEVTYFALYGAPFGEMIEWMGTGAFLYFGGMFVAFFLSTIAVFGKGKAAPAEKSPVKSESPVEKPATPFGAPVRPDYAPAETPAPAPVAEPVVGEEPAPAPVAEPVIAEAPAPTPVAEPVIAEAPAPAPVEEPVIVEAPAPAPAAEPVVAEAPVPPRAINPVFLKESVSAPTEAPAAPAAKPICGTCGVTLEPGMRFCHNCGASTAPKPEPKILPMREDPPADAPVPAAAVPPAPPTPPPARRPYCPNCRVDMEPGMRFCRFCGNPVHAVAVPGATANRSTVVSAGSMSGGASKAARKAVCPHCGARQLPAPQCKYCGTPMGMM